MNINLKDLNLPKDVIENSCGVVNIEGELHNTNNEIVVISQFGRSVGHGHVCHYTPTKEPMLHEILDMPLFKRILISSYKMDESTQVINGVRYTMACCAEANKDYTMASWLY